MRASVEVSSRQEAEAIRDGLGDPVTRAIVVCMGAIKSLPSERARMRVLQFLHDHFDEQQTGGVTK
jgi:hypothetical protein